MVSKARLHLSEKKIYQAYLCGNIGDNRRGVYHNLWNPYIQSPFPETLSVAWEWALSGVPKPQGNGRANTIIYYIILASHNAFLYFKAIKLCPICSLRRFFPFPAAYRSFGKPDILEVASTCQLSFKVSRSSQCVAEGSDV